MNIENLRLVENAGALVARFDVAFKPLTIKGFGIFQKSDGSRWISEPSSKIEMRNGESKWMKHAIITDEAIKDEIERLAKLAYDDKVFGEAPRNDDSSEEIPF